MLKVDAFLFPRTAQHEERNDGHQHAYPLIHIQLLAEYQQGTHQRHDRTGGIDRPDDGERKMLHAEIAECPRRKDNK